MSFANFLLYLIISIKCIKRKQSIIAPCFELETVFKFITPGHDV